MKLKNDISKLIKIAMIIVIIMSTMSMTKASAMAANVNISCQDTVEVGQSFTITVSGSAAQWELSLLVNGNKIQTNSQLDNGDSNQSINFSASYTPQSEGTLNISLEGSITEEYTGTTITSFTPKTITVVPAEQQSQSSSGSGSGGSVNHQLPVDGGGHQSTQQTAPKSSNNYLSSLSVNVGTLTPTFSRERLEYSLEFDEDFDYDTLNSLAVSALAEDSRAKVSGTGTVDVTTGENNIEVSVTAEDTSVRTYRISFIKPEEIKQSDLRLSSLVIKTVDDQGIMEEVDLNPKFDKETFDYQLEVSKNIEKLDVNGEVEKEDIEVMIEGADNLHTGENLVQIILTSPTDENVKSVYRITINKEDPLIGAEDENTELKEKNRKKLIIGITLGIIVILVIVLIALLIANHRKKGKSGHKDKDVFDEDDKESDDELEDKKGKLFDYDEEDTYLSDENLEKLNKKFKETDNEIEDDEKEKNESFDELAGLEESEKLNLKDDEESNTKIEKEEEKKKEEKIDNLLEEDYDKDDEARARKLAELEKEIKDKRKRLTKKDTDKKKDVKNKKEKDL